MPRWSTTPNSGRKVSYASCLLHHTIHNPDEIIELVINQIRGYELGELQNLSKENRAPFVVFMPRNPPSGPDANNTSRYNTMANALARQSNVSPFPADVPSALLVGSRSRLGSAYR